LKKTPSPNLNSDVFNTLKDRIIHWHYPPDYRLTEEGLCEEFGVSRSPVREALRMLVENGLVEKEAHRGYSVKQPDMREIYELYEVRLALELYVVTLLTKKGIPEVLWQEILDRIQDNATDYAEKDAEFHESLAILTNNKSLIQHLKSINERLQFIRVMDITTNDRLRVTCEQHTRIMECIKAGDVNRAREAIEMNIQYGRENVEQAVKSALAKSYMGI